MHYLEKPKRTRWRGAIRAALGRYSTSWRYRLAVSCGPVNGPEHARKMMRQARQWQTLIQAFRRCTDAMRAFGAAWDQARTTERGGG